MESSVSKSGIIEDSERVTVPIRIVYGTTTGNSEMLAEETADKLDELGLENTLSDTEELDPKELYKTETLLLLMSTDDDGEPPLMAEALYTFLNEKTEANLGHLSFSVLALGDSYYPDFCQAGKDFDQMLENLGAHRIAPRIDCDIHFWDDFEKWLETICPVLIEKQGIRTEYKEITNTFS